MTTVIFLKASFTFVIDGRNTTVEWHYNDVLKNKKKYTVQVRTNDIVRTRTFETNCLPTQNNSRNFITQTIYEQMP